MNYWLGGGTIQWSRWMLARKRRRVWFADVLAEMLDMGIPLGDALMQLSSTPSAGGMEAALVQVARGVQSGLPLGEALARSGAFPSNWAVMLNYAQRSENLSGVLRTLARLEERGSLLWQSFQIEYTITVVALLFPIWLFLSIYIMPTFISLYHGMGITLPLITRLTVALPHSALAHGLAMLCAIGLTVVLVTKWEQGWRPLGLWKPWLLQFQAATAASLAAALRGGLSTVEALQMAAEACSHPQYRAVLYGFSQQDTSSLSELLGKRPDLFGSQLRWMVKQGETYGNLGGALESISCYLDDEATRALQRLYVFLRVMALLLAGIVVGTIVLSIMAPLPMLTQMILGGQP